MNITLAEGIKLKSILSKQIRELEAEAHRVAFATIEKGTVPPKLARTLQDVEVEMERVRVDQRRLDLLIYVANSTHTVDFEGQQLALVEAIELAIQLRAKAEFYKQLSSSPKEEMQFGYSETPPLYRIALFDPEDYRQKAQQAEKAAHQLSNRINTKNYTVVLDFDGSAYF
ncbi:hypothetical protein ORD22_09005 [Sporosarcina sp. GW1-11]|uniref:hypothetical protein n=1 Tax=Sporosarcina sp. GW1-11 TaxID=2899126 RepID=UPI00294DEA95|nr:hypothetical protein [Sporosarcina sp. GW1-11]MDV6378366.1 hypothetical protein [Sporosarcina sp. GW1-11]